MKYLAYDAIDGDYEEFGTIEEARKHLEECFLVYGEYHPELNSCLIYKLHERVDYDIINSKDNHTDERGEDLGYPLDADEICQHKFVKEESKLELQEILSQADDVFLAKIEWMLNEEKAKRLKK